MERLTERELYDGKVCFTRCSKTTCKDKCSYCDIPREARGKLKEYEDLEEQCIKETTWSLRLLLEKWKEFFENIQELYEYRKLEEQGLLLKLPCQIGQRVYEIYRFLDEGAWEVDVHKIKLEDLDKIGKTVFLTQVEADEALKRMEKGE